MAALCRGASCPRIQEVLSIHRGHTWPLQWWCWGAKWCWAAPGCRWLAGTCCCPGVQEVSGSPGCFQSRGLRKAGGKGLQAKAAAFRRVLPVYTSLSCAFYTSLSPLPLSCRGAPGSGGGPGLQHIGGFLFQRMRK